MLRTLLLGLALLVTGCGSASLPMPSVTLSSCALPSLLSSGQVPSGGLGGPAVADLADGAARAGFSLDGGDFQLAVAKASKPRIDLDTARCEALAAQTPDGYPLVRFALSGYAIGYGAVSIASAATANVYSNPATVSGATGGVPVAPRQPPVPSYRHRFAWVVVVPDQRPTSCPAQEATAAPPPAAPQGTDYNYRVFLIDAMSGKAALVYDEGGPGPCGSGQRVAPSVSQPVDEVSVPWRLVSRDTDNYGGRIKAQVLPCDGYARSVNVTEGTTSVQVVVQRPIGYDCGRVSFASLALQSATVTTPLPPLIEHGPLGAYLEGFSRPRAQAGVTSGGELVNITPEDNHGHLTVHVGDVLVAIPFAGPNSGVLFSASNTSVLRPLSGGGLQEFRAVAPGTAELSVPATVCRPTFPPRTCPFNVMVTVS
jgi:hypothetical protein